MDEDEGWFKVRLDDGRVGFMNEATDQAGQRLGLEQLGLPEEMEILRDSSLPSGTGGNSYEYQTIRRRFMKWNAGPLDEIRTLMSKAGWEFVGQQDLLPSNTPGNDRHVEMSFRRLTRPGNPPLPELPRGPLDTPKGCLSTALVALTLPMLAFLFARTIAHRR